MKNVPIKINKAEIFERVSLSSAYTGAKDIKDPAIYDRVATINEDETLLTGFWQETCGIITEKLREFILSIEDSADELSITMELSGSYDEALTPSVVEDLKGVLTTGIAGRWFRFTYPEKAADWLSQSSTLLNRAFSKLCYRKKPTRKV